MNYILDKKPVGWNALLAWKELKTFNSNPRFVFDLRPFTDSSTRSHYLSDSSVYIRVKPLVPYTLPNLTTGAVTASCAWLCPNMQLFVAMPLSKFHWWTTWDLYFILTHKDTSLLYCFSPVKHKLLLDFLQLKWPLVPKNSYVGNSLLISWALNHGQFHFWWMNHMVIPRRLTSVWSGSDAYHKMFQS